MRSKTLPRQISKSVCIWKSVCQYRKVQTLYGWEKAYLDSCDLNPYIIS